MRVLIAGASGLVGKALGEALCNEGAEVLRLVRHVPNGADEVRWDPAAGHLSPDDIEGCDAIVNLSGENIGGLWTQERKAAIRNSRVDATRTLCDAMGKMKRPPKVLVSASAVGYYGDSGDTVVDESARLGKGFLAEVCRDWEAEARKAEAHGVRVVITRFGIVLSKESGILAKMLTPFRLGLGGRLGDGRQYMSWVTIDDVVGVIRWCISHDVARGPVNVVAPVAVTNAQFTEELAAALHRPAMLPVPEFVLHALPGDMGEEMLLASTRAVPKVLLDGNFDFRHPELGEALRHLLAE